MFASREIGVGRTHQNGVLMLSMPVGFLDIGGLDLLPCNLEGHLTSDYYLNC